MSPHSDTRAIQCYGLRKESKSCLLKDAWFHVPTNAFILLGYTDAELDQFGLQDLPPFKFAASPVPEPNTEGVLNVEHQTVFWNFVDLGAEYSLGHAFVFELFPLYLVVNTILGDDTPSVLNLVYWNERVPHVFEGKASPFEGRFFQWETLRARAKEWICFEAVILGDGGISAMAQRNGHDNDPNRAFNAFNSVQWWGFRNWMLRAAGVDGDAKTRPRLKIVVNDKRTEDGARSQTMDRRQILNVDEVVRHLRLGFPDAEVVPWNRSRCPETHDIGLSLMTPHPFEQIG